jgi:ketosteroid isomerase-like protein
MTEKTHVNELADRFFAAIETGDVESVASFYADDALIWHNTDQVEQPKADNLAVLGWLVKNTASREYRQLRRSMIDGGFVQQHVLHLEFADGRNADLPACLVVRVSDDRITRLDEYVDGAMVAATFGRA